MSVETKPTEDAAVFDERVLAYLAEEQSRPLPVSIVDADGRVRPLTAEEEKAEREAFARMMEELRAVPDDDPPDTLERMMRGIDENRPPGQKLFEGMY
jgi:hypothetical protein